MEEKPRPGNAQQRRRVPVDGVGAPGDGQRGGGRQGKGYREWAPPPPESAPSHGQGGRDDPPERGPGIPGEHLAQSQGSERRNAGDRSRPESAQSDKGCVTFVIAVGNAGSPGGEKGEGQKRRSQGGEQAGCLPSPVPAADQQRSHGSHGQRQEERQERPLVLAEDGAGQEEPGGDGAGHAAARAEQQDQRGADQTAERQIAVRARGAPSCQKVNAELPAATRAASRAAGAPAHRTAPSQRISSSAGKNIA